jgi:hypothetical protein
MQSRYDVSIIKTFDCVLKHCSAHQGYRGAKREIIQIFLEKDSESWHNCVYTHWSEEKILYLSYAAKQIEIILWGLKWIKRRW